MQPRTFTLLNLAGIFVVLAIGCATLANESFFLKWLFTMVTLGLILYGLLHVIIRGLEAPFWLGFFIFGLTHFLIGLLVQGYKSELTSTLVILWSSVFNVRGGYTSAATPEGVNNAVTLVFAMLGGFSAVLVARAKHRLR